MMLKRFLANPYLVDELNSSYSHVLKGAEIGRPSMRQPHSLVMIWKNILT